jgi:molybdopterin-guanine dinucleotide biosynthesis protein A
LDQGERKIDRWFATQKNSAVLFPDVQAFANINTPAELAHTESLVA